MQKTLLLLVVVLAAFTARAQYNLKVVVENVQSSQGFVEFGLFDSKKKFPKKGKQLRGIRLQAKTGKVEYVFKNLPNGRYAVAAFHDKDNNRKLTKTLVGIPKEPYGFSTNPKMSVIPPSFDKVSVKLKADAETTIKLLEPMF